MLCMCVCVCVRIHMFSSRSDCTEFMTTDMIGIKHGYSNFIQSIKFSLQPYCIPSMSSGHCLPLAHRNTCDASSQGFIKWD